MPNYTTNLNLVKQLESENYDINVVNGNLDIIDTNTTQNKNDIQNINDDIALMPTLANPNIFSAVNTFKENITAEKDLFLGIKLIGTSGYSKLSNGLILQWGTKSLANPTTYYQQGDFTFPIAFPTTCLHVSVDNARNSNAWYDLLATTVLLDKTSFRFMVRNVVGSNLIGTCTMTWFAIGY